MAHKTLIDGTAYEVSGGKTLVSGTAYEIEIGKTLVSGTAYAIPLHAEIFNMHINGALYSFEEGMTWKNWLASEYNVEGYTSKVVSTNEYPYDPSGNRVYYIMKFVNSKDGAINYSGPFSVLVTTEIHQFPEARLDAPVSGTNYWCYGTKTYCESIKNGAILPEEF